MKRQTTHALHRGEICRGEICRGEIGKRLMGTVFVYLCVLLPGPSLAETKSLKDMAQEVANHLRDQRQFLEVADLPMIFGDFRVPEAVVEAPMVDSTASSADSGSTRFAAPKVPQVTAPTFKCNGTMKMRGENVVFIGGASYRAGSDIDGYQIESITNFQVTVSKGGKTFTLNAR